MSPEQCRAEGAVSLLRQTLAMFLDHAGVFLGIATTALAPVTVLSLLATLAESGLTMPPRPAVMAGIVAAGVAQVLVLAAGLMSASALYQPVVAQVLVLAAGLMSASALYQPVVAQVLATPLRPVDLRPLLRAFRKRLIAYARLVGSFAASYAAWGLLPTAGMTVVMFFLPRTMRFFVSVLFLSLFAVVAIWLVRVQDAYGFASGAILMEGLTGEAARERSRAWSRRSAWWTRAAHHSWRPHWSS